MKRLSKCLKGEVIEEEEFEFKGGGQQDENVQEGHGDKDSGWK